MKLKQTSFLTKDGREKRTSGPKVKINLDGLFSGGGIKPLNLERGVAEVVARWDIESALELDLAQLKRMRVLASQVNDYKLSVRENQIELVFTPKRVDAQILFSN